MAKTVAKTPKTHPKWSKSPFFVQHFSLRIFLVGIIFGLQNSPKSDNITQKANEITHHITDFAYYNTHEVIRQTNKTLFECVRGMALRLHSPTASGWRNVALVGARFARARNTPTEWL